MSAHEVDDRSSEIAYSQPASGHHWSPIGSDESYGGTLTLTRTQGATARITFQGTRIQVMGLVSPQGVGGTPSSVYGLDNRPSARFTTTQASTTRPRVLFYDSGELDAGSHTLVVTNEAEGAFFWIDSFIITEAVEPEPAPEPSPDPPPQPAPVSAPPAAVTSPNRDVTQAPVTSASQGGFSSPTPRAPNTSRSLPASSVTQDGPDPSESVMEGGVKIIVTTRDSTSSSGSASPQLTGASSTSPSDGPNVGAIVGGVLGGLIIVLLAILALFVVKRRARPRSLLPETQVTQAYPTLAPSFGSSVQPLSTSSSPIPFSSEEDRSRYLAGSPVMYHAKSAGNSQPLGHQPQLSLNSTVVSATTGDSSGMNWTRGEQRPPSYQQA